MCMRAPRSRSREGEMVTVVLDRPKYAHNVAGAIRACSCFGADALYYTGARFAFAPGDRLPREERMKGYADVHWEATDRPFDRIPTGMVPVAVEVLPTARPLTTFDHPLHAVYVFGPEDGSIGQVFRRFCHHVVYIPSQHCLNLVGAMNVVLAHRVMQRQERGLEDIVHPGLIEARGVQEIPSVAGWDGHN